MEPPKTDPEVCGTVPLPPPPKTDPPPGCVVAVAAGALPNTDPLALGVEDAEPERRIFFKFDYIDHA